MKAFNILFYESEAGNLTKILEFERLAESLQDLVSDPPEEFFEAIKTHVPVHGWAEMENENVNVFVIFVERKDSPKTANSLGIDPGEFQKWLNDANPADLSDE